MGSERRWEGSGRGPRPVLTAAAARERARQALRRRLVHLVAETDGNVAEIARRMGKDRSTIRYHLRRFDLLGDSGVAEPLSSRRAEGPPQADPGAVSDP